MTLQQVLENASGKKLKLKINNNRSTMVSVRWESDLTRVSLHQMFLDAPKNVMEALACYIKGDDRVLAPSIKAFIQNQLTQLHYPSPANLKTAGNHFNLQELYDKVNAEYFEGRVNLSITWFGKERQPRSKIALGLYYDPMKLIKINRILDHADIPEYLISFVIYHEMLHHVCPAYVDAKGINQVHTREFKARETQFKDFERAQEWLRKHLNRFFGEID
jgi:hypothetical protein